MTKPTWHNCTACGRLRSAIVPGDGRCLVCFNLDRKAVEQAKFYEERKHTEQEAAKPSHVRRAERRAAAAAAVAIKDDTGAVRELPEVPAEAEAVEPGAVEPEVKVPWYRRWRKA